MNGKTINLPSTYMDMVTLGFIVLSLPLFLRATTRVHCVADR